MESKYKEFWLAKNPIDTVCTDMHVYDNCNPLLDNIHVIEHTALTDLQAKYDELKGTLDLANDEYVKQVGTWKIVQRLEESEKRMQSKYDSLKERADKLREALELEMGDGGLRISEEALQEYDQARGEDE